MRKNAKIQVINHFPKWQGWGFNRTDIKKTCRALIYEWFFWFGWVEIRKWRPLKQALNMLEEKRKNEM